MDLYYIIAIAYALFSVHIVIGGLKSKERFETGMGCSCIALAAVLALLRFCEWYLVIAFGFTVMGLLMSTFSTVLIHSERDKKDRKLDYGIPIICWLIGGALYYGAANAFYLDGNHPRIMLLVFTVLTLIHFLSTAYSFFKKMRYTSAIMTLLLIVILLGYWKCFLFISIPLTLCWMLFAIMLLTGLAIAIKIAERWSFYLFKRGVFIIPFLIKNIIRYSFIL